MLDIFPLNILYNPFKMCSFCTNSSCIFFLWIFMELALLLCRICMEGILNHSLGQSHWHYTVPHSPSGQSGMRCLVGAPQLTPWAPEVSHQMHRNVFNNSRCPSRQHQVCSSGYSINKGMTFRTTAIRHVSGAGVGCLNKGPRSFLL